MPGTPLLITSPLWLLGGSSSVSTLIFADSAASRPVQLLVQRVEPGPQRQSGAAHGDAPRTGQPQERCG